jgi:hypothetical protein
MHKSALEDVQDAPLGKGTLGRVRESLIHGLGVPSFSEDRRYIGCIVIPHCLVSTRWVSAVRLYCYRWDAKMHK